MSKQISAEDMEFAEAAVLEPGEVLSGEVIEITSRTSEYSPDGYPILTIRTDEGEERAFHAFHTVARNELARVAPQVGSKIAILYRGPQESAGGRSFEGYRVKSLDETAAPFDWGTERRLAEQGPVERFEDGEPGERVSRSSGDVEPDDGIPY